MIEIGEKYGCLTVLDDGIEYTTLDTYAELIKEQVELQQKIDFLLADIKYKHELVLTKSKKYRVDTLLQKHYKCKCKCGKLHYYSEKTIESCPKYCYRPIPIASELTYSNKAKNNISHKKQKYKDLECIVLLPRDECVPSEDYCKYYNEYRIKQISKNKEENSVESIKISKEKMITRLGIYPSVETFEGSQISLSDDT